MKNIIFLGITGLLILFIGCGKVKDLANIRVAIPYSTQVTVPQVDGYVGGVPIPGGIALNFPAVPISTNSQQYITEYHTSSSKIVSINMDSLSLQILAPAEQNFDFLDTVQLYISTSVLPEVLVAWQYNIAKAQNILVLTTAGDLELKNYFLADTMYFRMRTHINATPISGTRLNIATRFRMVANPLN